jgi:hypothetical protein
MAQFGVREQFTAPAPKPRWPAGSGPRIWRNPDGTLECSYDVPKKRTITMAMDQAPDDHMQDIAVELSQLLQGLSPTDRSRAEELIIKLIERDAGANADDPVPSASDEPPPFRGEPPRPGIDLPVPATGKVPVAIIPGIAPRAKLAGDRKRDANDYGFREGFLKRLPGSRIPRQL